MSGQYYMHRIHLVSKSASVQLFSKDKSYRSEEGTLNFSLDTSA